MTEARRWMLRGLAGCALAVVITSVLGGIRFYSPVPFWDMWNGYLEFYYRSFNEGWLPWWELHNEHRLVLAKALFWLELSLFKGNLQALFALNLVFAGLILWTFVAWLRRLQEDDHPVLLAQPVFYLLVVLAFSWMQQENFTWAFQSQFFMAYLLPLLAFYCLARSRGSDGFFVLAVLLGGLSALTMANGLLALPLLVLQAMLQRLGWRPVIVLLVTGFCVFGLYFSAYQSPEWHTPWSQSLMDNSGAVVVYFLAYLGGPLYVLLGDWSLIPALLAGVVMICSAAWLAWPLVFGQRHHPIELGLLVFILFIGGTALSTALGRAGLGSEMAQFLPSRYLTPALMAWSAMALLLYSRGLIGNGWKQAGGLLLLVLALGSAQLGVFADNSHIQARKAAVLTATVGVRDTDFIDRIYFDPERFRRLTLQALASGHSVGRLEAVRASADWQGRTMPELPERRCQGYLDRVMEWPLFAGTGYGYRLEGWLVDTERQRVPAHFALLASDQVQGYGLTGLPRPDVAGVHGKSAAESGFVAWLRTDKPLASAEVVRLVAQQEACVAELTVP
ncbi:hypothetical protein [Halopseudomonas salegens]|uniref:Uncharacterized protein n=1 Tax=Halopseudomonas salegens TaxID=1434072 RepID=A0A1H2HU40_9GAMM|nr:hypothetical protein [Halopseudomonas salegens]SDU35236.1 hypothetical protein SAMN05216210_3303 [Halopseudomonas salegens]